MESSEIYDLPKKERECSPSFPPKPVLADDVISEKEFMSKDFRFFFQHPYARLFIAYFVIFCNFMIYAEDPVAHSKSEANIPVLGNVFSFVATKYPPNAFVVVKVVFWLVALAAGLVAGKFLIHRIILNYTFKLEMFAKCQGSWMIMFLTVILSLFIWSMIYNAFLLLDSTMEEYQITGYMRMGNDVFMKAAACGTWGGDFVTAWMVTDMMLQDARLYPSWARPVRRLWNNPQRRWLRIVLFWLALFLSTTTVYTVILTDWISWDSVHRNIFATNEITRAFLASFILLMDLFILMQDWDFPHFDNDMEIKLPGFSTAHLYCKCIEHKDWAIEVTGKWFNYGIIIIVMLLDLNMWKNQIFYVPFDYGQYVGPDHRIYSVRSRDEILSYNESELSFEYRSMTLQAKYANLTHLNDSARLPFTLVATDDIMNSHYDGIAMAWKMFAFVPSIIAFIMFFALIGVYGRRPAKPTLKLDSTDAPDDARPKTPAKPDEPTLAKRHDRRLRIRQTLGDGSKKVVRLGDSFRVKNALEAMYRAPIRAAATASTPSNAVAPVDSKNQTTNQNAPAKNSAGVVNPAFSDSQPTSPVDSPPIYSTRV